MVQGANAITKIAIIVISIILAFYAAIELYVVITDGSDDILRVLGIGITLTLCILAFWGAYTENAILCYISLVACVIGFILALIYLIQCLIKDIYCETRDYIVKGLVLAVYGVLVVAVYCFIQAIK